MVGLALLILIILALIAGTAFLAYKFGDIILDMLTQLIGMPKEMIILSILGIICAVIGLKLISYLKRTGN